MKPERMCVKYTVCRVTQVAFVVTFRTFATDSIAEVKVRHDIVCQIAIFWGCITRPNSHLISGYRSAVFGARTCLKYATPMTSWKIAIFPTND